MNITQVAALCHILVSKRTICNVFNAISAMDIDSLHADSLLVHSTGPTRASRMFATQRCSNDYHVYLTRPA